MELDPTLRNSESFLTFQKHILEFIRPVVNSVYNCHNVKRIELIIQFRLYLSHLRGKKFKYDFQESLNPLCNCGHSIESTTHFLSTIIYH